MPILAPVQVAVIAVVPALAMWGARHVKVLDWVGPVVLCYLVGILWANIPALPVDRAISNALAMGTVPLAIPLLLFSMDFRGWLRLAKKTVVSFLLAVVSVLVLAAIGGVLFSGSVADAWKAAGMLVGVYTGGTPNLTAIGIALGVSEEMFIQVNGADVLVGAAYLLPLMTVVPIVYRRLLPAFRFTDPEAEGEPDAQEVQPAPWARRRIGLLLASIALAAGLVGGSIGVSILLFGEIQEALVILAITTGGIAFSFVEKVRAIGDSYEAGQYLLLMFCVTIGTIADVGEIVAAGPTILAYVAFVMLGSIVLHLVLAMVFRIDADTVVITSTAAIYGPPFIGPVANVLKNREVVVSGLTTGVVGLALGNYAGLALAYLVRALTRV